MSKEKDRAAAEAGHIELMSVKFEMTLPESSSKDVVLQTCCERLQEAAGGAVSVHDIQLFKLSRIRSTEKTLKGRVGFTSKHSLASHAENGVVSSSSSSSLALHSNILSPSSPDLDGALERQFSLLNSLS